MDKAYNGLHVALVAVIIILVSPFASDPYCLPKLFTAAVIVAMLYFMRPGHWYPYPRLATHGAVAVLAVAITSALSIDPLQSIMGRNHGQFYGLMSVVLVYMTYVVSARCRNQEQVSAAVRICAVLAAWLSIIEWFGYPIPMLPDNISSTGRSCATIGNPVFLGFVLVVALFRSSTGIASGSLMAQGCVFDRVKASWPLLAQYGLILGGILATKSRGAVVGLAVGLAVANRSTNKAMSAIALAAVMLVLLVFVRGTSSIANVDSARLSAWRIAVETFVDHPVFGSGPETFMQEYVRRRTDADVAVTPYATGHSCAHNIVLTVAATMGLVGLAALLYLLYGLYSLVHWHDLDDLAPVLAAFVAMSMFSPTPIMASLLLAVVVGAREASDAKVH